MEINWEIEEESHPKSANGPSAKQRNNNKFKTNPDEDAEHLSVDANRPSSIHSASLLGSIGAASQFSHNSSRKSAASYSEGTVGTMGIASSRGRLSSCSTVMVMEEHLVLNPVKQEVGRATTHTHTHTK